MIVQHANPPDIFALLELTGLSSMQRNSSLCTSRDRNFFGLTAEREHNLISVAGGEERMVGSFAITYSQTSKSRPREIGYLSDFKIHPNRHEDQVVLYMIRHAIRNNALNSMLCILSIPYLPQKRETMNMLYIKAFAGAKSALKGLIRYGRYLRNVSGCFFLCAAFREKDTLCRWIKRVSKFTFYSERYMLNLDSKYLTIEQIYHTLIFHLFNLTLWNKS